MTRSIYRFYDLRTAIAALAAAGVEDNAPVSFDAPTGEHYEEGSEIVADGPLTEVALEGHEVVLRG